MGAVSIERVETREEGRVYHFSDGATLLTPDRDGPADQTITGIIQEIFLRNDYLGHPFLTVVPAEPGRVILDIGGHMGGFAIVAARRYPQLRVHTFEPLGENFHLLKENVKRNGLADRVRAHNLALTQTTGTHTFFASSVNSGLNSLYPIDEAAAPRTLTVPTMALNEFLRRERIDGIYLLKLDCEGAEYEILYGCDAEVLRKIDLIAMEYHPFGPEGGRNADDLQRFLESHGFLCDQGLHPTACMLYAVRAACVAGPQRALVESYDGLARQAREAVRALLQQKAEAFAALHEDRAAAQRIMETQCGEIAALRGAFEDLGRDRAAAQRIMESQAAELEQARATMQQQARHLTEIYATRGWRALTKWRAARDRVFAPLRK